jgi:hypothetical protein
MNPLVLLLMFNVQGNNPTGRICHDARNKSYFKQVMLHNLEQQFAEPHGEQYNPIHILLAIAWSISQVIYLTNKTQLYLDEMEHISNIIRKVSTPFTPKSQL